MRFHELAAHPANPHCFAKLTVYKAEWFDLEAISAEYGPIRIVAVEKVPIIPVLEIEVLCRDAQTACALDETWMAYTEASPHRPHSMEEALVLG